MRCDNLICMCHQSPPFGQCSPNSMFKVPACSLGGLLLIVALSPTSEFVPGNLGAYGGLHRKAEAQSRVRCGFPGVGLAYRDQAQPGWGSTAQ